MTQDNDGNTLDNNNNNNNHASSNNKQNNNNNNKNNNSNNNNDKLLESAELITRGPGDGKSVDHTILCSRPAEQQQQQQQMQSTQHEDSKGNHNHNSNHTRTAPDSLSPLSAPSQLSQLSHQSHHSSSQEFTPPSALLRRNSSRRRYSLSWSQSVEERCHSGSIGATAPNAAAAAAATAASTSSQSQSQETADLTQDGGLGNAGCFSPSPSSFFLASQSPSSCSHSHLQSLPWARLVPCASPTAAITPNNIPLYPRAPAPDPSQQQQSASSASASQPIQLMGLSNLHIGDKFNEYTIGRGNHCDVIVPRPTPSDHSDHRDSNNNNDSDDNNNNNNVDPSSPRQRFHLLQSWAYGMISHEHCRIYTCLEPGHGPAVPTASTATSVTVYIQDDSNNGTLINKTTLLRKGQARVLYSGDEICLIHPTTLQKKVKQQRTLLPLLQQFSYIFINLLQPQPVMMPPPMPLLPLPTAAGAAAMAPAAPGFPTSTRKRKTAVDVRAMRPHSHHRRYPQPATSAATAAAANPTKQQQSRRQSNDPSQTAAATSHIPARHIELDYDIRQILGTGTVGEVRRAIHRKTGQERAVKIIKKPLGRFDFDMNSSIQAEVAILQQLEHPYVVHLVDCYVTPTVVYLVMEYLRGGDLYYRIVSKGRYTEVESRRVMRRLLSAIFYLHEERQIVHRDLKPENILLVSHDSDVDIKLTDFGLAKSVQGQLLKTFCGTPLYIPPEVSQRRHTVTGQGRYGKPADMWSLGVILYILLSGAPPFDAGMGFTTDLDTSTWTVDFPEEDWHDVSASAQDLVCRLLVTDPNRRWTVKQACQHDWILMSDGDTHTHPLDDPQLPSLTQKRLFTKVVGATRPAPATSASVAPAVVPAMLESDPSPDMKSRAMLAESPPLTQIAASISSNLTPLASSAGAGDTKSKPSKVKESSDLQEERQNHSLEKNERNGATDKNDEAITVGSANGVSGCLLSTPNVSSCKTHEKADGGSSNRVVAVSTAGDKTADLLSPSAVAGIVIEHSSPSRRPLSPVSINKKDASSAAAQSTSLPSATAAGKGSSSCAGRPGSSMNDECNGVVGDRPIAGDSGTDTTTAPALRLGVLPLPDSSTGRPANATSHKSSARSSKHLHHQKRKGASRPRSRDQKQQPQQPPSMESAYTELSEDEILSQFSEQTDSVSSFGTTTTATLENQPSTDGKAKDNNIKVDANRASSSSCQATDSSAADAAGKSADVGGATTKKKKDKTSRKRRVTDTLGGTDEYGNQDNAAKPAKASKRTGSSTATTTEATANKIGKASNKNRGSGDVDANTTDRRKQTTLMSWIKKKS